MTVRLRVIWLLLPFPRVVWIVRKGQNHWLFKLDFQVGKRRQEDLSKDKDVLLTLFDLKDGRGRREGGSLS